MRAIELYRSRDTACKSIARKLGIDPGARFGWVRAAEVPHPMFRTAPSRWPRTSGGSRERWSG